MTKSAYCLNVVFCRVTMPLGLFITMEDAVVYSDHVTRVLTGEYDRLHKLSLERHMDMVEVLMAFGVEDLGDVLHNHSSGDELSRELEHVIAMGWEIENELNLSIEEIPIFPRGFDPS